MTSRYLIDVQNRKSKIIHVYRNGDKYSRAALVLLRPIEQQKLDRIFRAIEEKLTLPHNKPIRKIYTIKGREIEDPILVKDQQYYVVGSFESFINTKYGSIYKWAIIGPVKWSKFADVIYEPPEQDESTMNQKLMYPWKNNTVNSARLPSKMTKSMSTYTTDRKLMKNSKIMALSMEQSKRPVSEPSNDIKAVKKRKGDKEYFASRDGKNSSGDGSITSPKISSVENRRSMDQFLNDSLKMSQMQDNTNDDILITNERIDNYDEENDSTIFKTEKQIENDKNEDLTDISENYLDNNKANPELDNKNNTENNDELMNNVNVIINEVETKSDSESLFEIHNDIHKKYEDDQIREVEYIFNDRDELYNEKEQNFDNSCDPSNLQSDSKEMIFIITETDDFEEENMDVKEFEENELKAQMKELDDSEECEEYSEKGDTVDFANKNMVKVEEYFLDNDENKNVAETENDWKFKTNSEFASETTNIIETNEENNNEDEIEIEISADKEEKDEIYQDNNDETDEEEKTDGENDISLNSEDNSNNVFKQNENMDMIAVDYEDQSNDKNKDDCKSDNPSPTENNNYISHDNDEIINKNFQSNDSDSSDVNYDFNETKNVQENKSFQINQDSLTDIKQASDLNVRNESEITNISEPSDCSTDQDEPVKSVDADQYNLRLETPNINPIAEKQFLYEVDNPDKISLNSYNNTMFDKVPEIVEKKEINKDSSEDIDTDESDYEADSIINNNKNDHKFKERESYDENSFDAYLNKNEPDSKDDHEIIYNTNDFTKDQQNDFVIDDDHLSIPDSSDATDNIIKDEQESREDKKHSVEEEDNQSLVDEDDREIENKHHSFVDEGEEEKDTVDKIENDDEESQNSNEIKDELEKSYDEEDIQKSEDEMVEHDDVNEEIESEKDSENNIVSSTEKEPTEIQIFESEKNDDDGDVIDIENIIKPFSEKDHTNEIFVSEKIEEDDNTQNSEKSASISENDLTRKQKENVSNDFSNFESKNDFSINPKEQYNRIDIKAESPNSFINDEKNDQEIYMNKDNLPYSKFNDSDKENAAKIIQKNFRGHLVRRELTHDADDIDNDIDESDGDGHRSYDEKESDDDENSNGVNLSWLKEGINDSVPTDKLEENSKFDSNYSDDIFSLNTNQ